MYICINIYIYNIYIYTHVFVCVVVFVSIYIYIWLRLFCFVFFRACPGQLLVYAICKEGYPENREKKVALVSPAMEKEVCKKKVGSRKKKWDLFITLT